MAFHGSRWHLLISMVRLSRRNSRLPPLSAYFQSGVNIHSLLFPGTVSGLLLCCSEVCFIYLLAGVAGSDGVLVERLLPPPRCQTPLRNPDHFKCVLLLVVL